MDSRAARGQFGQRAAEIAGFIIRMRGDAENTMRHWNKNTGNEKSGAADIPATLNYSVKRRGHESSFEIRENYKDRQLRLTFWKPNHNKRCLPR